MFIIFCYYYKQVLYDLGVNINLNVQILQLTTCEPGKIPINTINIWL